MVPSAFGRPILDLRSTRSGFDAEHVRGEQMRPAFLSPEATATVECLRELLQYSPSDILRMAWYDRALAIPANIAPARIAPACAALRALTSASASKLYLINGSLASPRASVSQDPEGQALSPLIPTIDDMARQGLVRMWPRPPVPGMTEVIAIAGEEIHDALSGLKSVRAALRAAQERADTVMRSHGC